MPTFLSALPHELGTVFSALGSVNAGGHIVLLLSALLFACAFEFVNGFHDTANAVATVIYTRSLKPTQAVVWSGLCNFAGVIFGGTAVAMGIMKLLPPDLFATSASTAALGAVFALLLGAIIWNVGTWFFGLPASSSHTLIGAIIGIGVAHAVHTGHPAASGVNWGKARDIGLALLISPVLGFSLSALLLMLSKKLSRGAALQHAPKNDERPNWKVRSTLIATCTGVSFAHGSNDGQKGIGLIMMILMALAPGHFALKSGPATAQTLAQIDAECSQAELALASLSAGKPPAAPQASEVLIVFERSASAAQTLSAPQKSATPPTVATALASLATARRTLGSVGSFETLSPESRLTVRASLQQLEGALAKAESNVSAPDALARVKGLRAKIKSITEYAPTWVLMLVALSIGLGTMIGWKRIVVTLGEKIGKQHMTYAQGASAELVAMTTIGISAAAGLPVSTTHVLSSGIAGTMVANRSGVQKNTVQAIATAWVLTLPVAAVLSACLYFAILSAFGA